MALAALGGAHGHRDRPRAARARAAVRPASCRGARRGRGSAVQAKPGITASSAVAPRPPPPAPSREGRGEVVPLPPPSPDLSQRPAEILDARAGLAQKLG